jgi:hypothetical protein
MIGDRRAKMFEKFVERAYVANVRKVNDKFPQDSENATLNLIIKGCGELRSRKEIVDKIKKSRNGYVYLEDIFNFENTKEGKLRKENIEKNKELKIELENEKNELIKYVYFADEEDLLKKLNDFEKREF